MCGVHFDHLVEADLGASANLPQSGKAGLGGEATQRLGGIGGDFLRQRRARTDDGHVAEPDVQQLR